MMRILYLCKRHYMGHDVIEDKYARLYEQPYQLAQLDNEVLGVCLSYRSCTARDEHHATKKGSLHWLGFSSGRIRQNLCLYPLKLLAVAKQFAPDVIIASSDCLHIALGQWVAAKTNSTFVADLYDDYETFGLSKIPGVKRVYRKALRKASVISCVSEHLAEHIRREYKTNAIVFSLPSTINREIFFPRNKTEARKKFGIDPNAIIVGTAGGLTPEKGIDIVYEAFLQLAKTNEKIQFLIAGPHPANFPPPKNPNIHYLGCLKHTDVADFFCSLDVGIVYLNDTQYGQLSFPQKALEMAACKIPMVVTAIGDMKYLFNAEKNELYTAGSSSSLASAIEEQLKSPYINELMIEDWESLSKKLFNYIIRFYEK